MIEVLVAVVGAIGLIIVEMLRRSTNSKNELRNEIRELKQQVKDLQEEVDEWRLRHYELLMSIAKEKE